MRDNGKEDAVGCEITRKRTLGKGGGGGADKRWGALWRYSTVWAVGQTLLPRSESLVPRLWHKDTRPGRIIPEYFWK